MAQAFQANRFEWKYIVDERRARGIRDFIRGHLEVDEHARDSPEHSYPVYSLYLDSPTLVLYRQTVQGLKNRFKLRLRFYDDRPTQPVFLEIKRRLDGVICKERAALGRDAVLPLLHGERPGLAALVRSAGNRHAELALDDFCRLTADLGATAAAYVSYVREAYVSPESDQLRVTLDRHLRGSPFDERQGLVPPTTGVAPDVRGVVLEIKFVDRFPHWLREMVWAFDLHRCSMPKYIRCVEALRLRPGGWLGPQGDQRGGRSVSGGHGQLSNVPREEGASRSAPRVPDGARDVKQESTA